MKTNNWDKGLQEDYNNMTKELGRLVLVYPRVDELTYEGQSGEESGMEPGQYEYVFLQELDSEHEVIASGQMDVGDVRFTFQHDSVVEEEGYVSPDEGNTLYKVLRITKVRNQTNNEVIYIKAFGRKLPRR